MQLNEILEENTLKSISKKTNISEEDIERLVSADFTQMKRAKALGFISILEREYKADLGTLKEQARTFYADSDEEKITLNTSAFQMKERRGKSKLFVLVILLLLGYALWHLATQFDQKQLNGLFSFDTVETSPTIVSETVKNSNELSIESVTVSVPEKGSTDVIVGKSEAIESNGTHIEENTTLF